MSETIVVVKVQPRARRNQVVGFSGDILRLRVTAPAQEGRANEAALELLARALGIARGRIRLVRGHASREKAIAVEGLNREEVRRRIERSVTGPDAPRRSE